MNQVIGRKCGFQRQHIPCEFRSDFYAFAIRRIFCPPPLLQVQFSPMQKFVWTAFSLKYHGSPELSALPDLIPVVSMHVFSCVILNRLEPNHVFRKHNFACKIQFPAGLTVTWNILKLIHLNLHLKIITNHEKKLKSAAVSVSLKIFVEFDLVIKQHCQG